MSADEAGGRLRAGRVGRPHGLDGSFHVSDPVAAVLERVAVGDALEVNGATRRVERLAGHAGRPILRLQDAHRREDAEALRGCDLHLPRAAAPPLGEDEWWAEDLEGCAVRDGARAIGTVAALLALPSCEVLEVHREGRPALLVPLVSDAVRTVDVAGRVIDVDLAFLGES